MSDQYQIAWKSTENGKVGVGPKLFTEAEAIALCAELNEQYPEIEHTPRIVDDTAPVETPPTKTRSRLGFTPLTDDDPFPFGPTHKGTPMKEVPSSYLDFISGLPWIKSWPAVVDYCERNRRSINQDLERSERT
jgi:hypothetical protein